MFQDDKADCMAWSWFYECELQLFLLTPWLVCLYHKLGRKVCYVLFSLPILVGIYINYKSVFYHHLTTGIFSIENYYMYSFYINKPWYKLEVYFFGIISGMFFIDVKEYKMSKRNKTEDYQEYSTVDFLHRSQKRVNGGIIRRVIPPLLFMLAITLYGIDTFLPFPV